MYMGYIGASTHKTNTLHPMYPFHGLGESLTKLNEAGGELRRQIIEIGMVLARNNKHMPRPYGMDIQEGDEIIVFIHDARGDFLIRYSAENAWFMWGVMPRCSG